MADGEHRPGASDAAGIATNPAAALSEERRAEIVRLRIAEDRVREVEVRLRQAQEQADRLSRALEHQAYETAYATWKLSSIQASRWWRIGQALTTGRRHPLRLLRAVLAALRGRPRPAPPERPLGYSGKPIRAITAAAAERIPVVRPDLTVAAILDTFSEQAFRYEWRQVADFGPKDWPEVLRRERPALLFVESAWKGNDGRWEYAMTSRSGPKQPLLDLVAWCREQGIPTVFWNKEDPANFDTFIETAKLFDWVFTTDEQCVPTYREILGHDRIGVLPFAAQPRIHNPISVPGGRRHDVAFAGMYFTQKHPERREQMRVLLEPAREFGLHIYNRYTGDDPRYAFPPEYRDHIVGSLPYERMLAANKEYKVFLNVNSVIDSPTMCARRVFELSACATPVLSGYSPAVEREFGDLVPIARTGEDTRAHLKRLLGDDLARDTLAHLAMRHVLAGHTFTHRVDAMFGRIGFPVPDRKMPVSVVMATNREDNIDQALARLAAQTHRPLQLVLMLHGLDHDPDDILARAKAAGLDDVVVRAADPLLTLGQVLNQAVEIADGDYVAKMDDDDLYGAHYLDDQLLAFSYSDADVVGKGAHYTYFASTGTTALRFPDQEHRYTGLVHGSTILARRELLAALKFGDLTAGEDTILMRRCRSEGARIYATDRFSFIYMRAADPAAHTWRADDERLLKGARVEFHDDPAPHVLI